MVSQKMKAAVAVAAMMMTVAAASGRNTSAEKEEEIRRQLENSGFAGEIVTRGNGAQKYEEYRVVRSGQCNDRRPAVLVRPKDAKDVARAVRAARRLNLPVSVRSGGHSHTCQGIRDGSLHIDLRRMNDVEKLDDNGLIAFGPAATFADLQKKYRRSEYTMPHGQCNTVAMGGFLLGGGYGALGLSSRYGWACDAIEEVEMVTADGDVATVSKNGIKWASGKQPSRFDASHPANASELLFALKGAGASFGIASRFKYRLIGRPEPLVMAAAALVETADDLRRIKAVADEGRFFIHLIKQFRYGASKVIMPTLASMTHRGGVFAALFSPVYLYRMLWHKTQYVAMGIMDFEAPGSKPDVAAALEAFERHGVRLMHSGEWWYRLTATNAIDANEDDFETMVGDPGGAPLGVDVVTFTGIKKLETLEDFILNDEDFGVASPDAASSDPGCVMCINTVFFVNKATEGVENSPDNCLYDSSGGEVHLDLTCVFDTAGSDPARATECQKTVAAKREVLSRLVKEADGRVLQYGNLPTCNDVSSEGYVPFYERYWGAYNYARLLEIKEKWDPDNVFNFCHSVGSADEDCCDERRFLEKQQQE